MVSLTVLRDSICWRSKWVTYGAMLAAFKVNRRGNDRDLDHAWFSFNRQCALGSYKLLMMRYTIFLSINFMISRDNAIPIFHPYLPIPPYHHPPSSLFTSSSSYEHTRPRKHNNIYFLPVVNQFGAISCGALRAPAIE